MTREESIKQVREIVRRSGTGAEIGAAMTAHFKRFIEPTKIDNIKDFRTPLLAPSSDHISALTPSRISE